MATVRELMKVAAQKIDEDTSKASELGAIYKFVIEGEDGGTFLINMREAPGITEENGPAQCTIKMAAADFVRMVESRGDPRQYLFMGKLKIEGNVGLAIKLRKLTDMLR